jgi:hypothetical protein
MPLFQCQNSSSLTWKYLKSRLHLSACILGKKCLQLGPKLPAIGHQNACISALTWLHFGIKTPACWTQLHADVFVTSAQRQAAEPIRMPSLCLNHIQIPTHFHAIQIVNFKYIREVLKTLKFLSKWHCLSVHKSWKA